MKTTKELSAEVVNHAKGLTNRKEREAYLELNYELFVQSDEYQLALKKTAMDIFENAIRRYNVELEKSSSEQLIDGEPKPLVITQKIEALKLAHTRLNSGEFTVSQVLEQTCNKDNPELGHLLWKGSTGKPIIRSDLKRYTPAPVHAPVIINNVEALLSMLKTAGCADINAEGKITFMLPRADFTQKKESNFLFTPMKKESAQETAKKAVDASDDANETSAPTKGSSKSGPE